ncbi:MAG: hypothetical protein J5658_03845 [Prevotella sp.]|nr:hypothetical protein [Prevotella sp.]
MKKKLIEAIKAKFVGIDDNTAKRLAERAIAKSEAITNDDEVAAAVEAIAWSDVLKSVSDFSADEAVKRYEEKYNLEKGERKKSPEKDDNSNKPAEPQVKPAPQQGGESGDKTAEFMDAIKGALAEQQKEFARQMKELSDGLASLRNGRIAENRKAQLNGLLKDLKDYQKRPYGRIQVEKMSDDEFDNFLAEVKEEVNDIVAENRASGAVVSPALGGRHIPSGPVKEATKEELDNLMGKFDMN